MEKVNYTFATPYAIGGTQAIFCATVPFAQALERYLSARDARQSMSPADADGIADCETQMRGAAREMDEMLASVARGCAW